MKAEWVDRKKRRYEDIECGNKLIESLPNAETETNQIFTVNEFKSHQTFGFSQKKLFFLGSNQ